MVAPLGANIVCAAVVGGIYFLLHSPSACEAPVFGWQMPACWMADYALKGAVLIWAAVFILQSIGRVMADSRNSAMEISRGRNLGMYASVGGILAAPSFLVILVFIHLALR